MPLVIIGLVAHGALVVLLVPGFDSLGKLKLLLATVTYPSPDGCLDRLLASRLYAATEGSLFILLHVAIQ